MGSESDVTPEKVGAAAAQCVRQMEETGAQLFKLLVPGQLCVVIALDSTADDLAVASDALAEFYEQD